MSLAWRQPRDVCAGRPREVVQRWPPGTAVPPSHPSPAKLCASARSKVIHRRARTGKSIAQPLSSLGAPFAAYAPGDEACARRPGFDILTPSSRLADNRSDASLNRDIAADPRVHRAANQAALFAHQRHGEWMFARGVAEKTRATRGLSAWKDDILLSLAHCRLSTTTGRVYAGRRVLKSLLIVSRHACCPFFCPI